MKNLLYYQIALTESGVLVHGNFLVLDNLVDLLHGVESVHLGHLDGQGPLDSLGGVGE